MFIKHLKLLEAIQRKGSDDDQNDQRPTDYKVQDDGLTDLERKINAKKGEQGVAGTDKPKTDQKQKQGERPTDPLSKAGSRASGAETRSKTWGLRPDAQAQAHLSDLHNADVGQDEISDEDAIRNAGISFTDFVNDVKPDTIPAVINKQLTRIVDTAPNWHMVKHLPGYLANAIRAMGRQVFSQFTSEKIEDIQVLANLQGAGPNSDKELRAFVGTIKKIGFQISLGNMDFERIMPGYQADIALYEAFGCQFLVVQDQFGQYVYGWTEKSGKFQPTPEQREKEQKAIGAAKKALPAPKK